MAGGTIHERTYYEVLGVPEDATKEEIRAAWRPLIAGIHPDREPDQAAKEAANQQAALINAAYSTLTDPAQRRRYDDQLRWERGQGSDENDTDQSAGGSGHHQHGHDDAAEDEEALWDWIQQEAADEADAAWERWENPPARDRLAEALSDLRRQGLSAFTVNGPVEDLVEAQVDFERRRRGESLLLTLPAITALMAALAVGEILFVGANVLYSPSLLLIGMGLALVLDLILTMMGARPLRLIAAKAGSAGSLSDGDTLSASAALAVRFVWGGVAAFFAVSVLVLLLRSILHLFVSIPLVEAVIGYGLMILPLAWTVIFLALWGARNLAGQSSPRNPEREHPEK